MKHPKSFIVVAVSFLLLAATTAPAEASSRRSPSHLIAVAGDSTTAQTSSWRDQMAQAGFAFAGFAKSGYTSTQVLSNIQPSSADVLIVKLGVNDIRYGVPTAKILPTIEAIVTKVGQGNPNQIVIVSAVVPSDLVSYGPKRLDRQARGATLNAALEALAARKGWRFIDPDVSFRTLNNGFTTGTTTDGVHPSPDAYATEAAVITEYLATILAR